MPRVAAFIFARGGSKGVPHKNIRPLAGKPLIAHAIETALAARYINRVIVSTDDEEIATVARAYGAEVPFMRPSELASDTSPELLSWKHALQAAFQDAEAELDAMVSVPTVTPLRATEDVERCIDKLLESGADLVLTGTPASRSPHFNMMKIDPDTQEATLYCQGADGKRFVRRQDAPDAFDVTPVAYAARPGYILRCDWLLEGKV